MPRRLVPMLLVVAVVVLALPGSDGSRRAASQTSDVVQLMQNDRPAARPGAGTWQRALDFATHYGAQRTPDVELYFQEVYRLAPQVGLDPGIVVAQSALETDTWRTGYWVNHLNPGAIGITYEVKRPTPGRTGRRRRGSSVLLPGRTTPGRRRRGVIVHLYLYAVGEIPLAILEPYKPLEDPGRLRRHRQDHRRPHGPLGGRSPIRAEDRRPRQRHLCPPPPPQRWPLRQLRQRLDADDANSATAWATTVTTIPTFAYLYFDLGAFGRSAPSAGSSPRAPRRRAGPGLQRPSGLDDHRHHWQRCPALTWQARCLAGCRPVTSASSSATRTRTPSLGP